MVHLLVLCHVDIEGFLRFKDFFFAFFCLFFVGFSGPIDPEKPTIKVRYGPISGTICDVGFFSKKVEIKLSKKNFLFQILFSVVYC
jgi:hypothetical protein